MKDAAIEKLITEYKKTIPDKIHLIKTLSSDLQSCKSLESLKALYLAIHKLAGNAGTYGFSEVSAVCKEKEALFKSLIENFDEQALPPPFFIELDLLLQNITKGFTHEK